MGFTIRFGGWRPVQLEEGLGTLHGRGLSPLRGVGYRFEVWHQMVDGFPGPFRSEGRLHPSGSTPGGSSSRPPVSFETDLARFAGDGVELELADGRRLPVRVRADGSLLAHARPQAAPGRD
jgi:hypothetical protein